MHITDQALLSEWVKHIQKKYFPKTDHYYEKIEKDPAVEKKEEIKEEYLPYLTARREWTFMCGDLVKAKTNWQRLSYGLLLSNVIAVIGAITLALSVRYIPYAVKVDNLGNSVFSGTLNTLKTNDISAPMMNAWIRSFITASRSVIADPVAEKHQLDFAYQAAIGQSKTVLDNFYHTRNPFDFAKTGTIDVTINAVLPKSNNSYQVNWTETNRNVDGNIVSVNHFEALMTVTRHSSNEINDINVNPLGIYVNYLSWDQQI